MSASVRGVLRTVNWRERIKLKNKRRRKRKKKKKKKARLGVGGKRRKGQHKAKGKIAAGKKNAAKQKKAPGGFRFSGKSIVCDSENKITQTCSAKSVPPKEKNPAVRQGHLQAGDALRRPVEGHRHQRQDHPRPGVQGALGLHQEEGPPGVSILSKIHCVRFGWNRHGEQLLHAPETEWQNLRASTRAAPSARSTASGTAARCSR